MNNDFEEELKKTCRDANGEVPVVQYTEWLRYYGIVLSNILSDNKEFHYQSICDDLLFIEATDVPKEQEENYNECRNMIRNFMRAHAFAKRYDYITGKETSPLEVYNSVLNGTAQYGDNPEYTPLI